MSETETASPTSTAIKAIQDQLKAEWSEKVAKLEADLKAAQHQVEGNQFLSVEKPEPFDAFYLDRWCRETDPKELGRLQAAFLKEFSFYNLLIRTHIGNDDRGSVEIMVVRARSCMDHYRKEAMTKQEWYEMRSFVRGFFAGVRSFKRKTR
jgi:hypothetical protein